MSDTASNWIVVWKDQGGSSPPVKDSSYRSREMALNAACELNRYQTAVRIEGPDGELIERAAIEHLCSKGRPRRP